MTNEVEVSNLVAKELGEFLVQKSPIYNTSNHKYVGEFTNQMYATGGAINIKIPNNPTVTRGLAVSPTGIQDLLVPFTVTPNDIYNVTRNVDFFEEIFDIVRHARALTDDNEAEIVDNYIYPVFQGINAQIESQAAYDLKTTSYMTPIDGIEKLGGVNTFDAISSVNTMANIMKLAPERYMLMNEQDGQAVASSLQNMFNERINENITKTAMIGGKEKGRLAGMDLLKSTELYTHFAGPEAGNTGITVTSISSDGTQITLAGVAALTNVRIKAGDSISIPSVYLCDRISRNQVNYRLVVKAAEDANGDGAGNVVVTISYPLLVSGEHQNVFSLPAPGAAAAVFPNRNLNFGYTKFGISTAPIKLPNIRGAINSERQKGDGPSFHVFSQGNVSSGENIFRISTLIGIRAFAPYIIELPSRP